MSLDLGAAMVNDGNSSPLQLLHHGGMYINTTEKPMALLPIFWSGIAKKRQSKITSPMQPTIDIVLAAIGLVCNMFVLIAILTIPVLREMRTSIFILSLTLADLLVSGCVLGVAVGFGHYTPFLLAGGDTLISCRLWATVTVIACTASSLNIMAIAIDRYFFLTDPLHYHLRVTTKKVIIILLMIWALSVIIAVLPFLSAAELKRPEDVSIVYYADNKNVTKQPYCSLTPTREYTILVVTVVIIIPALFVIVIYTKILQVAMHHYRQMREQSTVVGTYGTGNNSPEGERKSVEQPETGKKSEEKVEIKQEVKERSTLSMISGKVENIALKPSHSGNFLSSNVDSIHSVPVTPCDSKTPGTNHQSVLLCNVERPNRPSVECESKSRSSSQQTSKRFSFSTHFKKQEIKTVIVLSVIVGTYLICWMPFALLSVWLEIYPGYFSKLQREMCLWLAYSNSCWDPLIYAILNKDFRLAVLGVMHKYRRRSQSQDVHIIM